MKVVAKKGSHSKVYYLRIPHDFIETFGITESDDFTLNVNFDKDGNLVLCYKRVKK
ncbi:hypothetical protein HA72_2285 [Metallosphaera sedula]|uniref:AbrB family transcriptional regulator n=4 Tax=Metallosphaera TaxID=41980 RepID=A4YJ21_METS5|nr:hypothetical protein Msed_2285 [Metallosphaera sedula DSM 5348]AIM28406.1 hypothetical protein HA72_2285 [Metallosphaera sedula]QCO30229.1 AbrB/MazE/SpoVT family DNA-binding domain-containing protein [Metallosphaera prunae]BBL48482.1 hypothetical protein MJ1HA_2614 [Metallosphaera sedula]